MDGNAENAREREPVWLSMSDSAAFAGVTRRTLYNWIAKGRIETARTAGGKLRVKKSTLLTTEARVD